MHIAFSLGRCARHSPHLVPREEGLLQGWCGALLVGLLLCSAWWKSLSLSFPERQGTM